MQADDIPASVGEDNVRMRVNNDGCVNASLELRVIEGDWQLKIERINDS